MSSSHQSWRDSVLWFLYSSLLLVLSYLWGQGLPCVATVCAASSESGLGRVSLCEDTRVPISQTKLRRAKAPGQSWSQSQRVWGLTSLSAGPLPALVINPLWATRLAGQGAERKPSLLHLGVENREYNRHSVGRPSTGSLPGQQLACPT